MSPIAITQGYFSKILFFKVLKKNFFDTGSCSQVCCLLGLVMGIRNIEILELEQVHLLAQVLQIFLGKNTL
jgi:hypothetical protein